MEGSGTPRRARRGAGAAARAAGRCFAIFGNHDHEAPRRGARRARRERRPPARRRRGRWSRRRSGRCRSSAPTTFARAARARSRRCSRASRAAPGHLRLLLLHDPRPSATCRRATSTSRSRATPTAASSGSSARARLDGAVAHALARPRPLRARHEPPLRAPRHRLLRLPAAHRRARRGVGARAGDGELAVSSKSVGPSAEAPRRLRRAGSAGPGGVAAPVLAGEACGAGGGGRDRSSSTGDRSLALPSNAALVAPARRARAALRRSAPPGPRQAAGGQESSAERPLRTPLTAGSASRSTAETSVRRRTHGGARLRTACRLPRAARPL